MPALVLNKAKKSKKPVKGPRVYVHHVALHNLAEFIRAAVAKPSEGYDALCEAQLEVEDLADNNPGSDLVDDLQMAIGDAMHWLEKVGRPGANEEALADLLVEAYVNIADAYNVIVAHAVLKED